MPPHLHLDDFICFGLYSSGHSFTRAYRPYLEPLGLTYPQYVVLIVLWAEQDAGKDALSVGQIGEQVCLETSTLTPLLKRLETQGLVERNRAPHDERQVLVRLSTKGLELKTRGQAIPHRMLEASNLDPDWLKALNQQIRTLKEALETTLSIEPTQGT